MKKVLRAILIVLLTLAVLAAACVLLFRHFVTNQITDRGGMENPFLESTYEEDAGSEAAADASAEEGHQTEK